MEQDTDAAIPIIPYIPFFVGKQYEFDFGEWKYILTFLSLRQAHIQSLTTGNEETVDILIVPLRVNLYLVSWQEADTAVIAQVQDFEYGIVHTCTTFHRASIYRQGRFRVLV